VPVSPSGPNERTLLAVTERNGCTYFDVHVTPRASRTALAGAHAGALKLSLSAPPVDGAANDALIAWIAETLGVPKRAVRIVRGEHARKKHVCVEGLHAAVVRAAVHANDAPPKNARS
jgi:hypothetical protein